MYSIVLMTALTTAPQAPEFNGYFRDLIQSRGCYDSGESRSSGGTGSCQGLFGGRIRAFFSFGGSCYGSCSGRGNGCYSSGQSCNGNAPSYACNGSVPAYSCNGAPSYSCNGGMAYAPSFSCSGGGMENSAPMMDYGSPYATPSPAYYSGPIVSSGCFGAGMGMPSGPMTYQGTPSGQGYQTSPDAMIPNPNLPNNGAPYATPMVVPPPEVRDERYYMKNQLPQPGSTVSSRATVIVKLPADAKLFAEGRPLTLTSAERSFVTPELPTGREYSYTFRVEYERGGRTLSETQKVNVQAGKTANLEFNDLVLGVAPKTNNSTPTATVKSGAYPTSKPTAPVTMPSSERARITVKVPENATLYIDNRKNESNGTVREFTTPAVPAGRDFSYTMALETMKDGRPEQLTQKVIFRAGEIVTVDLTTPPNTADRRAAN